MEEQGTGALWWNYMVSLGILIEECMNASFFPFDNHVSRCHMLESLKQCFEDVDIRKNTQEEGIWFYYYTDWPYLHTRIDDVIPKWGGQLWSCVNASNTTISNEERMIISFPSNAHQITEAETLPEK